MDDFPTLAFMPAGQALTLRDLEDCNRLTARFGLSLSPVQAGRLEERRIQALCRTARLEFGTGIMKELIYAFCDSPYLFQDNYEDTLAGLQDLFYHFRGESGERLSDVELIRIMAELFNGKAQGSLDYLGGTGLENLCRALRGGGSNGESDADD